jgi:hypothetical protein
MQITLFCLICFILIVNEYSCVVIIESDPPYDTTQNNCFYATGRYLTGNELTRITISGTSNDDFLATCCYMCRALSECVGWYYFSILSVCVFFKSVNTIPAYGSFYYAGSNTQSKFWTCKEQKDKWYYENGLVWTKQSVESSRVNRDGCCHDCFWSTAVGGCQSYLYYEETNDCYHSTKNYNTSLSVDVAGMYTGSAEKEFTPYQP